MCGVGACVGTGVGTDVGVGPGVGAGAGVDVPVCSGVLVGFDRGRASAALRPSPVSSLAATGSASAMLQRLTSGSGEAAATASAQTAAATSSGRIL